MKGDGMRKKNQKEIYCTVNMDTPYGRHVMECMELLKGRFDLSASRIMQDALIAYESETRGKFPSFQMPGEKEWIILMLGRMHMAGRKIPVGQTY